MKQFEVFIPVDFRITLTALNDVEAGDKAERVADTFLLEAKPYLLNIPGIGPVALEVVPVDEETDDTPDVFEVREVKTSGTLDKLGRVPASPYNFVAALDEAHLRKHGLMGDVILGGVDVVSGPSTPSACPIVAAEREVNPDAI